MSLPVSRLCSLPIQIPSGEKLLPLGVLINSEKGTITAIVVQGGYILPENIVEKQHVWLSPKNPEPNAHGDDWREFSVENKNKSSFGKISEIWIDPLNFAVTKFECEKFLLGILPAHRVFSIQDVYEVLPDKKIIVIDDDSRVYAEKEVLVPCP